MNSIRSQNPYIAIACGGTGGHLFPGLAVAQQLKQRGCEVALLISPKDVDQQGVKSAFGMEVVTLPAIGLQNGNYFSFVASFWNSFRTARKLFQHRQPDAVLAMGGFTSAPPVLAARFHASKKLRSKTFLHESNTIPGRANRFLARFVDEAFVGFPETGSRLTTRKTTPTGTPVRPQFSILSDSARESAANKLGLDSRRPIVLVVGGSQGATGVNNMVLSALPLLAQKNWQWLHLTGANDFEKVKSGYAALGIAAVVKPFLAEMDLALGAATAAISRAGASSLAELAAVRLPSLLVPYPTAADNHQFFNARIYVLSGAARLLEQKDAQPESVATILTELVEDASVRAKMMDALGLWHAPDSAARIATNIINVACRGLEARKPESDTDLLTGSPASPKKLSTA